VVMACGRYSNRHEDIFLALELGVACALRSTGNRGNLSQFRTCVSLANENLFGSAQQQLSRLLRPRLMFIRLRLRHHSYFSLAFRLRREHQEPGSAGSNYVCRVPASQNAIHQVTSALESVPLRACHPTLLEFPRIKSVAFGNCLSNTIGATPKRK
jgi:hypothetical protein